MPYNAAITHSRWWIVPAVSRPSVRVLVVVVCLLCATQTHAQTATVTIGGMVYEDVNGDSQLNDAVARPNVNVRVYADTNNDNVLNTGDAYIADAITGTDGRYSISVTPSTNGNHYFVAVDSRSVTPSAGFNAGSAVGDVWAEQTYGDDWRTATLDLGARYGGRDSEITGTANRSDKYNPASTTFTNLTYRHLALVDVASGSISNLDWAFSFNVVTNTRAGAADDDDTKANRTVQGSLRQFLQNANAINKSNAMRFVPTVTGQGGNGTWRVTVTSPLPSITDGGTTIDGTTYNAADGVTVRDPNAGQFGMGGTVGTDGRQLAQVPKPEFTIQGNGIPPVGLDIAASDTTIRNLAITGFGTSADNPPANIRVGSFVRSVLIEHNIIGSSATGFSDPGDAARSRGDNILLQLGSFGTIRNNLVGFAAGSGVQDNSGSWTIINNEIRGNGLSGVRMNGGTTSGNLIIDNNDTGITALGGVVEQNTVRNNGRSAAMGSNAGIRLDGLYGLVQHNIVAGNYGAGVLVQATADHNTISQNSISANGTTTDAFGNGATGQIGIDLLQPTDDQQRGTAPFVTLNDVQDNDTGGNGGQNFAVLQQATIDGGNLTISGFAAPNAQIELFVAAPDPSGFGEGQTYLLTLTEGAPNDADTSIGSYSGAINGVDQGSDTTNRFRFSIPVPSGVTTGIKITATATVDGSTSEFGGLVTVNATPTAITLIRFTATPQPNSVMLGWETATELRTAGFHVLRSATGSRDDATRVTTELIAAKGEGARGAMYSWIDSAVESGVTYWYWIEEVDAGGASAVYGPVVARVGMWRVWLPVAR